MITAYLWQHNGFWQCVCPDTPHVNATSQIRGGAGIDPDGDQCKAYIVEAYNREVAPDSAVTLAAFTFIDRPQGWENPNDRSATEVVVVPYDPAADQTLEPLPGR